MALRRRQRGMAPAGLGALALLLAACGASSAISASPETPSPSVQPNACNLFSDSDVAAALAPTTPVSPAPTGVPTLTHIYSVVKVTEGGTKTAGQCTWRDVDSGAQIIALVLPSTQVSKLADFTGGATQVGTAYIQEQSDRGFVAVQDGPVALAITLVLEGDQSVRTSRLADLARTASGAAIPSISAAPASAAATSTSAIASGPGAKVQGQTASSKVQETDQLQFNPTSVSIQAGQVLEWDNTSQIAHNVTFDDYPDITSDTMNNGDTYQVKFTKPGTYQYHCTFHPGMNGTITVA